MHFVRENANRQVLTCSTDYRWCQRVARGSVGLEVVEDMAANTVFINVPMVKVAGEFNPIHPYEHTGRRMLAEKVERLKAHWLAGGHRTTCRPVSEPVMRPAPPKLDDKTQAWLDRQLAMIRRKGRARR